MDRHIAARARNRFLVALVLKIAASTMGWYLHSPWILGFVCPLSIMLAYVLIGANRPDPSLTPEKFADSCYYLGFIFTVTSIIFGLFDLPNIGTQMSAIAVRFGAAMTSTVLGLSVRVILVSFRQDVDDAIKLAEGKVIDATYQLYDQLTIAVEKLSIFERQVSDATNQSITRVSFGVEELIKSYGTKLATFFELLADAHTQAFEAAQTELHESSSQLSRMLDDYSAGMVQNMQGIEDRVTMFTDAIEKRLERTTFPDDYFARGLAKPVANLGEAAAGVALAIRSASGDIDKALTSIRSGLATVASLGGDAQTATTVLAQMTRTQQSLLDESRTHIAALDATQQKLAGLSVDVGGHKEAMSSATGVLKEHAVHMERLVGALQAVSVLRCGSPGREGVARPASGLFRWRR